MNSGIVDIEVVTLMRLLFGALVELPCTLRANTAATLDALPTLWEMRNAGEEDSSSSKKLQTESACTKHNVNKYPAPTCQAHAT